MNISKEEFLKALIEAYEAGWYGCLELKEEAAKDIADKFSSVVNCDQTQWNIGPKLSDFVNESDRNQWTVFLNSFERT